MNYQKIYDNICSNTKSQNRVKGGGVYYEAHHILPKCMGGNGYARQWKTHSNIVLLTAKEHFVVHKLLYCIHPNNKSIFHGYRMMAKMSAKTNNRNFNISSREYEEIRVEFAKSVSGINAPSKRPEVAGKISEALKGRELSQESKDKVSQTLKEYFKNNENPFKGKKHSDETKQKLSNSRKGKSVSPKTIEALIKSNLGKKRSDETRKLLSDKAKQRPPMSQEVKDKISKSVTEVQTGRPCKEETKLKISQKLMGHKSFRTGPTSEETKRKISDAQKGKKLSDEHRLKLSIAAKNRKRKPLSEETKRKIGNANRKKQLTNE
jgi:hypothetical protein